MCHELALERRHLPPLFLCELARRRTSLEIGQSRLGSDHIRGAHHTLCLHRRTMRRKSSFQGLQFRPLLLCELARRRTSLEIS